MKLFVAVVVVLGVALAQENPSMGPVTSLDGVDVFSVFPDVDGSRFALGEIHQQLVGIKNNAEEPINITSISGHLVNPFDFSYYIQNFTDMELGMVLGAGDQVSLLYRYAPYTSLDPMAFHLVTVLNYHTSSRMFSSTLYNSTIELYEPASTLDLSQMVSYAGAVSVMCLLVAAMYHVATTDPTKTKKSKTSSSSKKSASNDWAPSVSKSKRK